MIFIEYRSIDTAEDKILRLEKLNSRLVNLLWVAVQISTEKKPATVNQIIVNGFSQLADIPRCSMFLLEPGVGLTEAAACGRIPGEVRWPCPAVTEMLSTALVNPNSRTATFCLTIPDFRCQQCPHRDCVIRVAVVCLFHSSTGETQGILCAFSTHCPDINRDTQMLLDLYSNQVGLTLENISLNQKLQEFAFVDPLTGLYNRRHFYERLQGELARSTRKNEKVSLLMIDVDDFKQYNDTFGHIAGDGVLRRLGAILKSTVRQMDVIVRYGGEEFTVILPETDLTGAVAAAEHIRYNIENAWFVNRKVTVSIGAASFPDQATDLNQLVEVSDRAMYAAKKAGKNQVATID